MKRGQGTSKLERRVLAAGLSISEFGRRFYKVRLTFFSGFARKLKLHLNLECIYRLSPAFSSRKLQLSNFQENPPTSKESRTSVFVLTYLALKKNLKK